MIPAFAGQSITATAAPGAPRPASGLAGVLGDLPAFEAVSVGSEAGGDAISKFALVQAQLAGLNPAKVIDRAELPGKGDLPASTAEQEALIGDLAKPGPGDMLSSLTRVEVRSVSLDLRDAAPGSDVPFNAVLAPDTDVKDDLKADAQVTRMREAVSDAFEETRGIERQIINAPSPIRPQSPPVLDKPASPDLPRGDAVVASGSPQPSGNPVPIGKVLPDGLRPSSDVPEPERVVLSDAQKQSARQEVKPASLVQSDLGRKDLTSEPLANPNSEPGNSDILIAQGDVVASKAAPSLPVSGLIAGQQELRSAPQRSAPRAPLSETSVTKGAAIETDAAIEDAAAVEVPRRAAQVDRSSVTARASDSLASNADLTGTAAAQATANSIASSQSSGLSSAVSAGPNLANSGAQMASPSAADKALAPQLEQAIDQLAQTREASRNARSELTVRHAEFGPINMRLEAAGGDLRAILANRDPGFVPAVQAALAERAIAATSDTSNQSNSQSGSRQSENNSGGQQSGSQTAGNWGSGAGSDGRYGSFPGGQGNSPQPSLEHLNGERQSSLSRGDDGTNAPQAKDPRDKGLFA